MKTKKIDTTLRINKVTVSNLNNLKMDSIRGGLSNVNTEGDYCDTEMTCGATMCNYASCAKTGDQLTCYPTAGYIPSAAC